MAQLYLASQSPRRRELLSTLGVAFTILPAEIDETPLASESAEACVLRLAEDKASAVWNSPDRRESIPVLAADTIVVVDGDILGKPDDRSHAREMLARLSGRSHWVMTAVAMCDGLKQRQLIQTSEVSFAKLNNDEIARYVATGEPDDKAGAYAIQGLAAAFITKLSGSYSGVVGLPLYETRILLREFGIETVV